MVYINRKEYFNAAHKLYNDNWSKEKNCEVFGSCANANWHGHNFELTVTVKGHVNHETGFVIDLKVLAKIIKENIIDKLNHKNLNTEVNFLQGKMPSCEVLIMCIWEILEKALEVHTEAKLHKLTLFETEKNFVEYYGEK